MAKDNRSKHFDATEHANATGAAGRRAKRKAPSAAQGPSEDANHPLALERLTLIAQITNPVVGAGPLQQQVLALLDQVRSAYGVGASVVRTLDGQNLNLLAATGVPTSQLDQQMSASEGIASRMIAERRPLTIEDVETESTTAALASRARGNRSKYWFRSYAGAPLLVEGSVVGLLGIYATDQVRHFSASELNHLQIVANHIAISIVNDRLYRDLIESRGALQAQIRKRERAEQERQVIEEQLRHAQRMESLGHLAGGVAHDFNNLLTVILGGVEQLRAQASASPSSSWMQWVEYIDSAAHRAADLTKQLLAFSRKQPNNPTVFDLCEQVRAVQQILHRLVREDIELSLSCDEGGCLVRADASQIEQVIVNLVVNARDVVSKGGHIKVGCTRLSGDAPELTEQHGLMKQRGLMPQDGGKTGPHAVLWVRDDGAGMDAETAQMVFEPFFTTKGPGAGTGLGLAMVYGIVTQAGGTVAVDTAPGEGATFRVYLPICEEEAASRPAGVIQPAVAHESAVVLVCEDEASVRQVLCATLRSAGHRVLEAADGEAALAVAGEVAEPLDLLVTDMVMPGMNGRELAVRMLEMFPDLRCLLVSGYLGEDEAEASDGHVWHCTLPKPFRPQVLLDRVYEVLQSRG